jgi:two-component system NtrC family sensor kinase
MGGAARAKTIPGQTEVFAVCPGGNRGKVSDSLTMINGNHEGGRATGMEDKRYYHSLTRNMVTIMILVSFAPLLLITTIIGYRFETSYRYKVLDHLEELVQKHQQNINIFLNEKLAYIQVLANSYTFEQLSDEVFLEHKLKVLQEAYGGIFVDLGVVNDKGIQISYAGAFRLDKADYSGAEWFQKAISRKYFISDVFLGLRHQPHFIVTVKLQREEEAAWILRATIDFETFNSLVESIRIGETGSAFIINREGEFQTKSHMEPALGKEFLMRLLSKTASEDGYQVIGEDGFGAVHSVKGPERTMERDVLAGEMSYNGKTFIYVTTPLKSGEWILAYQQDEADAFSDMDHARKLTIFIFILGGFGIALMAIVLSRKMVRRIERADLEKEMMNEQVIEAGKLASVGELAAGIAHEINNPIAIMVEEAGWIGDLLMEEEFSESENLSEFTRALSQIRTQGERCKEITHKLLSFARRTDPRMRDVHLNDLIEEILDISEQRSKFSNVKIVKNLTSNLPLISASPSEVQQVLLNLINNAIDAIGAGGGTIEITSRSENGMVVVDVADNGHGIPKAILSRIFDPFFTTKPVGKGTGLGLSICFGIIKKMGGEISVNSAVGVGTTFHVRFPQATSTGD